MVVTEVEAAVLVTETARVAEATQVATAATVVATEAASGDQSAVIAEIFESFSVGFCDVRWVCVRPLFVSGSGFSTSKLEKES